MEISGHGRAQELASLLLGTQDIDQQAAKPSASSATQQDQVQISEYAKDLQRITSLTNGSADARASKIAGIRQALDAGTYDVSGRKVGDALIRQVLTDAVL
ncbi:MAG: flagellar biosynthesis anti-sigma factor FlgM [Nitrospirota bacterium]|nr:flagellar biosynthesis anti-sigma factor FlgM [Nitrospirota bacterium]MDE3223847.1 flagellar biosynthesis anti-sigma factor FlgM [Nitrospirota bacterium]MDE3241103.1 flagellar biosynthesis anti-sigma factor FlgM [Nitrospirota bacterium]